MSRIVGVLSLVLALGLWSSSLVAQSEGADHAVVVVPDSSVEHPGEHGKKAHTNHLILLSASPAGKAGVQPMGETPNSLACVYKLVSRLVPGCPIATSKAGPTGGNGTIAIVDAYDYPSAYQDLSTFSKQFGLPVLPQCSKNRTSSCFQKVIAANSPPPTDCGWSQEAALDIEWAHALAPNASIVLVEAASNSVLDLMVAVDFASAFANPTGVTAGTGLGQVSMSWGAGEFDGETAYDSHLTAPGVVYFAASGDTGGSTIYPGASPFVVSAGGTSIIRSAGNFVEEDAWAGSGGGSSLYEPMHAYQSVTAGLPGTFRAVPDFSFDADPNSGVAVYDSTPCTVKGLTQVGWQVFGGTSVAAPSLAGIVNLAGSKYNSTGTELSTIYSCYATPTCYNSNFHDITSGTAGSFSATGRWNFITGVGSNVGLNGK